MAGCPKRRAKREAAERAKVDGGIAPQVDEVVAQKVEGATAQDALPTCEPAAKPILKSLEFLVSEDCALSDVKLATKDIPHSRQPESQPSVEEYNEVISQLTACHKVINLLLEDTKEKISAAETISAADMAIRVNSYFEECDKRKRSYTVPGLAYAIGFITRKQLIAFVSEKHETLPGYIVARALMRIEEQRNVEILSGNGMMTGHKIDLATNFDWSDTKNKGRDEDKPAQPTITQNIINYNSLPPQTLTVEEWQQKFLEQQKGRADGQAASTAIDVK